MSNIDNRISNHMRLLGNEWVKAGKPEPGTIAYIQLFLKSNEKPHYVLKSGRWWVFRSKDLHKKYIDALKSGTSSRSYEPRPLIKTECGVM